MRLHSAQVLPEERNGRHHQQHLQVTLFLTHSINLSPFLPPTVYSLYLYLYTSIDLSSRSCCSQCLLLDPDIAVQEQDAAGKSDCHQLNHHREERLQPR